MLRGVADVPTPRTSRRVPQLPTRGTAARRFLWASVVGIAVSGGAFAWMVTGGTFRFFRSVPFSNFYDVQARSLLHGTWSMPASVLTIEGIRTDGRTFMYYGPVPAIMRLPVLLFTHRLDGRLTEPSLLIAFLVALMLASLLSWRIRQIIRGPVEVSGREAGLTAGLIIVIGLGTVFFFLGSTAQVYEEAELWGAAFTLGALYALVGFLERPSAKGLVSTGILATVAMLTRGSVGIGPLVAMGLAATIYLLVWISNVAPRWNSTAQMLTRVSGIRATDTPGRFGIGLLAAMGIPLALYITINEIKFATPFSIPLSRQVLTFENAHRRAALAANGGSLFGLKFLPTNLLQFIRPDALTVTRVFPWIFFPGKALVLGNVLYSTRDWTSSIPASMPVLFLLALLGLLVVYRPGSHRLRTVSSSTDSATGQSEPVMATGTASPGITVLRLPLLGSAAGTGGILIIGFIAERYLADAMPFLVLAALAGWHSAMKRGPGSRMGSAPRTVRRLAAALLAGLALFISIYVMAPTISTIDHVAVQPYLAGKISAVQAYDAGQVPLKVWMLKQTRTTELNMFEQVSGSKVPQPKDVSLTALIPAFLLSELQSAFIIGFVIFVPFLIIDLVVASILMSMGMMMLPPTLISLPFKILLFILVDGWTLVVHSLLVSFR